MSFRTLLSVIRVAVPIFNASSFRWAMREYTVERARRSRAIVSLTVKRVSVMLKAPANPAASFAARWRLPIDSAFSALSLPSICAFFKRANHRQALTNGPEAYASFCGDGRKCGVAIRL